MQKCRSCHRLIALKLGCSQFPTLSKRSSTLTSEKLLPRFTATDYQNWKGDWELWDGFAIAMSSRRFGRHQTLATRLSYAFSSAIEKENCTAEAIAELDWVVNDRTVVRPDLIVVCGEVPRRHLHTPPGLVAEVLSESTRQNDLNFKRELYESEGVATYLVIDPDSAEVTKHRLRDGRYESTRHRDTVDVTLCGDCEVQIDVSRLFR